MRSKICKVKESLLDCYLSDVHTWWYTPIITVLRRLRQEDHLVPGQPGIYRDPASEKERKKRVEDLPNCRVNILIFTLAFP